MTFTAMNKDGAFPVADPKLEAYKWAFVAKNKINPGAGHTMKFDGEDVEVTVDGVGTMKFVKGD